MIKIDYQLEYPDLSPQEQARLADQIAATIRHHIVTIACSVKKDNGEFINSTKIDVSGGVRIGPLLMRGKSGGRTDCRNCGGDGFLSSEPGVCPACKGTGHE